MRIVHLSGAARQDRKSQRKELEDVLKNRAAMKDAEGLGPRAALKRKMQTLHSEEDKRLFVVQARLDAILGSCLGSMDSVRSGVRCYMAFVDNMGHREGSYLPPSLDMVLTWSTFFRSEGTFSNYLGYVRTACMTFGVAVDVFREPAIRRCKEAIKKRCIADQRPKMWIQMSMLVEMVNWCELEHLVNGNEVAKMYALLFVTTYVFLLRMPSEAIPIKAGKVGGQACLYMEHGELVLALAKRYIFVLCRECEQAIAVLQEKQKKWKHSATRMLVQ